MKYAFVQLRRVWPISVQCRVLGVSVAGYHEHLARWASSAPRRHLYGQRFRTRRHATDEAIAWLLWYNKTRLHSTLDYISPMQFEENWLTVRSKQARS